MKKTQKILFILGIILIGGLMFQNQQLISALIKDEQVYKNIVVEDNEANFIPEADAQTGSLNWISCFEDPNYDWSLFSTTPKYDSPWSTLMFPQRSHDSIWYRNETYTLEYPSRNFIDINGDGLLDFVYTNHAYYTDNTKWFKSIRDCVMLNNGGGWNIVYRCEAKEVNGVLTFFGDCAQL